jgi:hypothetical protein
MGDAVDRESIGDDDEVVALALESRRVVVVLGYVVGGDDGSLPRRTVSG